MLFAVPASQAPSQTLPRAGTTTRIDIVAAGRHWTATIGDTPAARDFLSQLPLQVMLKRFGGNEMIADLPRALTREGAPASVTPRAGDVAFYAPWGNLALFYADGHASPGLVLLGRIEGPPETLERPHLLRVLIRRSEPAS